MRRSKKIIWVSSTPVFLPGQKNKNYFREGWVQGIFNEIALRNDIEMTVVSPVEWKEEIKKYAESDIYYRDFHTTVYTTQYEKATEEELYSIFHEIDPDIIHLWGT